MIENEKEELRLLRQMAKTARLFYVVGIVVLVLVGLIFVLPFLFGAIHGASPEFWTWTVGLALPALVLVVFWPFISKLFRS